MKKIVVVVIINLFILAGCARIPISDKKLYELVESEIETNEPTVYVPFDDFIIRPGNCLQSWICEYNPNNASAVLEYSNSSIEDPFPVWGIYTIGSSSQHLLNIYLQDFIMNDFLFDESYGNDLVGMFTYLDENGYDFRLGYLNSTNELSRESDGNKDYFTYGTQFSYWSTEECDDVFELKCYSIIQNVKAEDLDEVPTEEEYVEYVDGKDVETMDFVEYLEFTHLTPNLYICAFDITTDEAMDLEEEIRPYYNEKYLDFNVLPCENVGLAGFIDSNGGMSSDQVDGELRYPRDPYYNFYP